MVSKTIRHGKVTLKRQAVPRPAFSIFAETVLEVYKAFDRLPAEACVPDGWPPYDTATVRSVFIIGPDKQLNLSMTYPMNVGRNFAEVLRACQTALSFR